MPEKLNSSPDLSPTGHNADLKPKTAPTLESLGFLDLDEGLYNEQLENTTLSAMINDPWALAVGVESLSNETFYFDTNKLLFGALLYFFTEQKPIDLVALQSFLTERNWLDRAGGPLRLIDIVSLTSTGRNIQSYIEPLKNLAAMRRLRMTGLRLVEQTRAPANPEDIIAGTQEQIQTLYSDREKETLPIGNFLSDYNQELIRRARENKPLQGLDTGFERLNELTGGLKKSDLLILAARPSIGKTALCLNLGLHVAKEQGAGVLIFSLEMSKEQLVDRLKSTYHDIPLKSIQNPGRLENEEAEIVFGDGDSLGKLPIYINDQGAMTCDRIQAIATQYQSAHNIGLIIIDYAQLVQGNGGNRTEEMTNVSQGLKRIAKKTNLPVLALSQLNRKVEERPDKRPQMADLRESGSFEQDADIIMFLYRPGFYGLQNKETGAPYQDETELIVAKQRNGETGLVDLEWYPQTVRFGSMYNNFVRNLRKEREGQFDPPAITEPIEEEERTPQADDLF